MKNGIFRRMISLGGIAILAGTLGAGNLAAQSGPRDQLREQRRERAEGGHERREMLENALAGLDLTDAQKGQIAQLQEEFRTESERIREEIGTLHEQARRQMREGDTEGAEATREQIREKQEELRNGAQALREQIGMILTDAQKARLKELHAGRDSTRSPRQGDCPERGEIFESLNLTDAQQAQIDELRAGFKAENGPTIERMKELRGQMREQLRNRDREGAQATRAQIGELRKELAAAGGELRERIGAVLTDEQKAILKEHQGQMEECRRLKMEERREEGGGFPGTEMEEEIEPMLE